MRRGQSSATNGSPQPRLQKSQTGCTGLLLTPYVLFGAGAMGSVRRTLARCPSFRSVKQFMLNSIQVGTQEQSLATPTPICRLPATLKFSSTTTIPSSISKMPCILSVPPSLRDLVQPPPPPAVLAPLAGTQSPHTAIASPPLLHPLCLRGYPVQPAWPPFPLPGYSSATSGIRPH